MKVEVSPDGAGLVSHAGSALLAGVADRVGLTRALSRGSPVCGAPVRYDYGASVSAIWR